MSESITPAISNRICQHMNKDHADAIVLYAKAYGNSPEAEAAEMIAIDSDGMDLSVKTEAETLPIRITFDHQLANAEDAHHTLVDMLKQAKKGA